MSMPARFQKIRQILGGRTPSTGPARTPCYNPPRCLVLLDQILW
jgi:hypothetical protein